MSRLMDWIATALAIIWLAGPALADELPQPQGPVMLTITGELAHTNGDGAARFDMAMIDALDQRTSLVVTPWYEGQQEFSGPRLSDLMEAVGATGSALRIVAVNDYSATMPWSDIDSFPVILAMRHNGQPMSVRDKGPLFVIYPFGEFPDLLNEVIFSRSVWQVVGIEVLP
jgi:hypothetical protein